MSHMQVLFIHPQEFHFQTRVGNFRQPTMAATARTLRMSGTLSHGLCHQVSSRPMTTMCMKKAMLSMDNPAGGGGSSGGERKPASRMSACVVVSEPKTDKGKDLGMLLQCVAEKMLSSWMKYVRKHKPWRFNIQMVFEKVIIDCRFFTLLAIAGSLVGSVLCFVEGCVLTLDSYLHYFHSLSQMAEPIQVVPILIEAIDMFLVGSAMFTFGMALHVMFVGQQSIQGTGSALSRNFNLQKFPAWMGMESPIQAKSRMGHAVMMFLQVQVLEKLKSIPVTNGIDLACFAGAVFLSSASIFVLSKTVSARAVDTI